MRMLSWEFWLAYDVVKLMAWCLLRTFCQWEVKGKGLAAPEGPLIVVSNHISAADPFVLAASLPRRIIFMGKEELFRSLPGRMLYRSLGAFPVRRGYHDRKALRRASKVLERGHVLGMFPEGTRGSDIYMKRGHAGTALIALRVGAPLLPVGITGTENLKGIGDLFRRPRITVNIGEPFYLTTPPGKLTAARLSEATDLIMEHIAALLPESYQGVYRSGALRPRQSEPTLAPARFHHRSTTG